MKNDNDLELLKNLEEKKSFKVFIEHDDFGIFHYDDEKNRYESKFGFITLEAIIKAIKDDTYFIQVKVSN